MQKSLVLVLCFLSLMGSVSAYGVYLNCPGTVESGQFLKCSLDSDFPAGTIVYLSFSDQAKVIDRQPATIPDNQGTQYKLFDTTGLGNGQYKVTVDSEGKISGYRSDSVVEQSVSIFGAIATPTLLKTTLPVVTQATIVKITAVPQTLQVTTVPETQAPQEENITPSTTPTKSLEDMIREQNEKIDAQNTLIAEQNKKLSEQNDLLSQITGYFKKLFGW